MNLNKLTIKSQEALAEAQDAASQLGHAEILPLHILQSLVLQEQGAVASILKRIGGSLEHLTQQLNEKLEQDIIVGIGKSYGIEAMLKKNTGRLTGWMSYTYSRSLRKFESTVRDENISQGEFFPSNYDKPHDFTFLMNYQLSRGVKFSANFTYNTGRPVTAPVSKYSIQHILSVLNYSQRNQFRIPDYHRLDISLTFGVGRRKDRKLSDELIFSIYNVYGRKNAYSVYFNQGGFAYKLSVLGTVFPSISYNFKI